VNVFDTMLLVREHARMLGRPGREGFYNVTPYMFVEDVEPVATFMKQALGATESYRTTGAAGGTHLEMQVGDSKIMMGGNTPGGVTSQPTALFLYVQDVDRIYQSALAAGAASMMEPGPMFDEPRGAGFRDPFGNQWFVARHGA
jgi:uncharacterized glyoxalase superfamily protein PhnB